MNRTATALGILFGAGGIALAFVFPLCIGGLFILIGMFLLVVGALTPPMLPPEASRTEGAVYMAQNMQMGNSRTGQGG